MNCACLFKMSPFADCIGSENSRINAGKGKEGIYMLNTALLPSYFIIFWSWEGSCTDYERRSDKVEVGIGNRLQIALDHFKFSGFPILSWSMWPAKRKAERNLNSRLRSELTNFDFLMEEWTTYEILNLSQMSPIFLV